MSRLVPHHRPENLRAITATEPVSAVQWATLGGLANWCRGHGGMVIPWSCIGYLVGSGTTDTLRFRFKPKFGAMRRVWRFNLSAEGEGAKATITCGVSSATDFYPSTLLSGRRDSYTVIEDLSTIGDTTASVSVTVQATGGDITVESVSCYEETRRILGADTDDYGVDLTTLRPRQPIADFDWQGVSGVIDAYKEADARRAGFFHYSVADADALTVGSTSQTSLFPLAIPLTGAIPTTGDTTTTVTVSARAKVTGGTGVIRFVSSEAGDTEDVNVTATSFGVVSGTLTIETEDFDIADGRQSNAWEEVTITAADPAGQTISVSAIDIFRESTPV